MRSICLGRCLPLLADPPCPLAVPTGTPLLEVLGHLDASVKHRTYQLPVQEM